MEISQLYELANSNSEKKEKQRERKERKSTRKMLGTNNIAFDTKPFKLTGNRLLNEE